MSEVTSEKRSYITGIAMEMTGMFKTVSAPTRVLLSPSAVSLSPPPPPILLILLFSHSTPSVSEISSEERSYVTDIALEGNKYVKDSPHLPLQGNKFL